MFENYAALSKHIKIKNSIYFGFLLNTEIKFKIDETPLFC